MITKLLYIKNLGKFKDSTMLYSSWDGAFSKVNLIYADNGSGKTTFTQMLKSLGKSKYDQNLIKRRSFGAETPISISLMRGKKQVNFKKNSWSEYNDRVEVFDAFFIESNVYVISFDEKNNKDGLGVLVGEEVIQLYERIKELQSLRTKETNKRHNIKKKIKAEPNIDVAHWEEVIQQSRNASEKITKKIAKCNERITKLTEESGLLEQINAYLSCLCPDLCLTKLNRKNNNKLVYNIKICGHEVRSDVEAVSLKHTLSEGEKNSLALSFFLAKIAKKNELEQSIVVFDDPMSSLDYHRRSVTLNQLSSVARRSKQFFLLSHDMGFVKDFMDRNPGALSLRIKNNGETSYIDVFDVKWETLTGIFKDVGVLKMYVDKRSDSGYSARDVVRCIRPVLEGFFRIKYFGYVTDNMWLGSFICNIRDAKSEADLYYSQKVNLAELEDINEYAKIYHHSNPQCLEIPINEYELWIYCKRTLELLHKL